MPRSRTTTQSPSTAQSRTAAPSRTTRRVPAPLSYLPVPRLVDRVAGLRQAPVLPDLRRSSYAQRLTQTYWENDARLLLASQAAVAEDLRLLHAAQDERDALAARRQDLVERLAALGPVDLTARGDAEEHLPGSAVADRRRREHERRCAGLEAELRALADQEAACLRGEREARARVIEEFTAAQARSLRMRHYYSRRLATFARHVPASSSEPVAVPDLELPASTWAVGPCPWLATPAAPLPAAPRPAEATTPEESR